MIPDEAACLELHAKYRSNSKIVEHCKTVATVSMVMVEQVARRGGRVDSDAVRAGALLHDIGRSEVQTVEHGVRGAAILKAEGVDQEVVEIVRRHVGAGISAGEAKSLGLPDFDYIPRTLEQRIVCFADKMVESDRVRPFDGEVKRFVKKGHDVQRLLALKDGLEEDLEADPEALVLDNVKAVT